MLPSHFLSLAVPVFCLLLHIADSVKTPTLHDLYLWIDCEPLGQGLYLSRFCVPGIQLVLIKCVLES